MDDDVLQYNSNTSKWDVVANTNAISGNTSGDGKRNHVNEKAILRSGNVTASGSFGYSCRMSREGKYAIVGSYRDTISGVADRGTAYVFHKVGTSWNRVELSFTSTSADRIGASVAISDDGRYVAVGSYLDDANATDGGAVYIFVRSGINTWTEQQKLVHSDIEASDNFGESIDGLALSSNGEYLIAGARVKNGGAGAVYIFVRSGVNWAQQQKIEATTITASNNFGISVDISGEGDVAIIGEPNEDTTAADSGAAYIFTRSGTTWTRQQTLKASNAGTDDDFGVSVAISKDGSYCVIGAYLEDTTGANAGSIYIFSKANTTWTEQQLIQSSDIATGDHFGWSVSISENGEKIVVGAKNKSTATGAVYIFEKNGSSWIQLQKTQSSELQATDVYGWNTNISSDGTFYIASAIGEDTGASAAGAAYIFEIDSAVQKANVVQVQGSVASVTIADTSDVLIVNADLDGETITLPSDLVDGRILKVIYKSAVTGAGITYSPTITGVSDGTKSANDINTFMYSTALSEWIIYEN